MKIEVTLEGRDLEAFKAATPIARVRRNGHQAGPAITPEDVLREGLFALLGRHSSPWRDALGRGGR